MHRSRMASPAVVLAVAISAAACASDPGPRLAAHDARFAAHDARLAALDARVHVLESERTARQGAAKGEEEPEYQAPESGWSLSGGGSEAYAVHLDRDVMRAGHPTVRLAPIAATHDRYGTYARTLDASPFLGKRVRFSAWVKTQGTTKRADFWARVQARDSPPDGVGLGGRWTYLPKSSEWTHEEIVLDVDPQGDRFNYGVGIAGPGKLWVDEPKMEVVGADVPVTPMYPGEVTVGEWTMTGVGAPDYALAADGKGVRVERKVDGSKRWVAVVRAVPADALRGKKVTATLDVRTDGLDAEGLCLLKIQRSRDLAYQGFIEAQSAPVAASTPSPRRCTVSATIAQDARWILYGFTYRGAGTARILGGTLK